ncbi:MAG: tetratricopeptide repeat protein [Clostridiales bacterium]|nr:tetratricopeptide repeat protein [Clostridiales bacterium]
MDILPYLPQNKEAAEKFETGWHLFKKFQDYKLSQPLFSEAIFLVPDFALAYHCRGICFVHLSEVERGMSDLRKARELGLDRPEYHYGMAVGHAAQNDNEAALESFNTAIKTKPEMGEAYEERADLHIKLGNDDDALRDYSKAIELNVFRIGHCYYKRALVYISRNELEKALADLNEAKIFGNKDWNIYYNRGHCNYKLNRLEKAAEDYRTVLFLNPFLADAYYCLGNTLYEMQDFDGAIHNHSQVIAKEPEAFEGYFARGLAHLTKEEFDFAIEDFEKAISLNPEDAEAHYLLSEAHAGKGQEEKAQTALQRAKDLGFED